MRPLCRMFDINTGFGQVIATSKTVYANFLPVALLGDKITPHLSGHRHAVSMIVTGNPTVFVEGRPVARLGSVNICGHRMITGSPNVLTS